MYLVPGIIFCIIFAIFSILHLYFSYKENEKGRAYTKPFCISALGIGIAFLIPNHPLVYIGAFLGCIGDILLINKKKQYLFGLGMLFFLAGHCCYLAEMIISIPYKIENVYYYVFAAIYVLLILIIYLLARKKIGMKSIAIGFYMSFLLMVVIFSGFFMTGIASIKLSSGILIFVGYIMFLVSDSLIVYINFFKNVKRSHLYTMSTYLIAQFCILLGFVLLLI